MVLHPGQLSLLQELPIHLELAGNSPSSSHSGSSFTILCQLVQSQETHYKGSSISLMSSRKIDTMTVLSEISWTRFGPVDPKRFYTQLFLLIQMMLILLSFIRNSTFSHTQFWSVGRSIGREHEIEMNASEVLQNFGNTTLKEIKRLNIHLYQDKMLCARLICIVPCQIHPFPLSISSWCSHF